jgi:hypothetical protein
MSAPARGSITSSAQPPSPGFSLRLTAALSIKKFPPDTWRDRSAELSFQEADHVRSMPGLDERDMSAPLAWPARHSRSASRWFAGL